LPSGSRINSHHDAMANPTVVFDLDGTLVDSAPDLVAALNAVFRRSGLSAIEYDAARNMVGAGARAMIERGLAAQRRTLPASEIEQLREQYIEHYAAHIADHSRPFPNVEATLDELRLRGCRLAVCTNKLEWLSIKLLDALGLTSRFAAICGADTFGVSKPDPAILRGTVARVGSRIEEAIMVGDAITDIAVARAAGVPVIAVDFGYSETPVAALGPDRVVSSFAGMTEVIFALAAVKKSQVPHNVNR
jgi:phosphoglycolate phosphatase